MRRPRSGPWRHAAPPLAPPLSPQLPVPTSCPLHPLAPSPLGQARIALSEVVELLEAAEAKAYYGLAINWAPLQALTEALLEQSVLTVR